METSSISQAGIDSNLINQKINELSQGTQSKSDTEKVGPIGGTDTVKITANISEKPAIAFEPIDEEQANILAQLVANDLNTQSFGMSTQTGIDALRAFI